MDEQDFYASDLSVDVYDAFYEANLAYSPVAGDVAFYIARAKAQGPRVLELAVGTGRVAIPLAQAGFDVTGVDLSPAMLAKARQNIAAAGVADKIKLVEGGMEDFAIDGVFDLAIIAFRSFHHVGSAEGQRQTLAHIRKHLRPGGLLVFDVFDADLTTVVPGATSPAQPREIIDPATGLRVRRTSLSRDCDPAAQTFVEHMRIDAIDASGAVVRMQDVSFTMRWNTVNEMACMLELAGYRVEGCLGDFEGGPHRYKSEQIWLARTP